MAKLKSFIESYLKNQKISDYEGWLALYGKDAEGEYQKSRAEADNLYERSRAEHGARASALYSKGLSGSGYSDFLNHAAYAKRQDATERAGVVREKTELENRKGYLSYLEDEAAATEAIEKENADEEKKIFSDLLSKKLLSESAAISYLTTRGVEPERAKTLAKQSLEVLYGSQSYIDQVIAEASSARMDYTAAYKYAIAKGLSEEAAHSAANIAAFYATEQSMNKYYY